MYRFMRLVVNFCRECRDSIGERCRRLLRGGNKLKTIEGVVTALYTDHGWIDDSIFFKMDAVTDKVPLRVGQKVKAVIEEDPRSHRLRAVKVDALSDDYDALGLPRPKIGHLVISITAVTEDAVYVDPDVSFSLDLVVEGFVPYEGDWIEVVFAIHPTDGSITVRAVKPMNLRKVEEVLITSVEGQEGVVDDTIFYTLDSLKLPSGYVPQVDDAVNVVVVDSVQYPYVWRALSMTPVF